MLRHVLAIGFLSFVFLCYSQNIDSLKTIVRTATNDTTRCGALEKLIEAEADENTWSKYNDRLKEIAGKNLESLKPADPLYITYNRFYADALCNEAILIQNRGDNANALELYEKSYIIYNGLNYPSGIANSLNGLGMIYNYQGNIQKALQYYHKCLKIQENINDKQGAAYTLLNIGYVYSNQGNEAKSLECYFKSLKLLQEINDKSGQARAYNNIGVRYGDRGDFENALMYYNKALKIHEETGSKAGIAGCENNIGFIYQAQNKYADAIACFEKSLKLREELKDKEGMAYTILNFARVYEHQKNYSKALEYALRSYALSRELGYPENIRRASEMLKKIYIAQKNYPKALEMYEVFIQMSDSVDNIKTRSAAIKKQVEIEFEKKETEIKTLAKAEQEKIQLKANEDKKRQSIIIYSVIGGLVMMGLFLAIVIRSLRHNKKANKIISAQKKEVESQKHLVEEKQKEIVDSINYAKRIQYSLLAHEAFLKQELPDHFVLFKPKDIVSGDFYWATSVRSPGMREERKGTGSDSNPQSPVAERFYLAVCDSTGHGVPGAFMSLLNIGFLSEAINEKNIMLPNEVLEYARERLIATISKEGKQDGFDGILVCFDKSNNIITYSAANNSPVIIKNGRMETLAADKMPVGLGERKDKFKLYTIHANKGEMIFLYTDGYADQFGGPKGKKFKYKPLNELLLLNSGRSSEEQKLLLEKAFEEWKDNLEQVDDVCLSDQVAIATLFSPSSLS